MKISEEISQQCEYNQRINKRKFKNLSFVACRLMLISCSKPNKLNVLTVTISCMEI